jgi:GTP cyclohydrolase IA
MIKYTVYEFNDDVFLLVEKIKIFQRQHDLRNIYPVVKGGVPLACKLSQYLNLPLTDSISSDTLIVDDLIDSGRTRERYKTNYFACIHTKQKDKNLYNTFYCRHVDQGEWIEYWWEGTEQGSGIQDNIVRILQFIGEDPSRPGLIDTPMRIEKMYKEFFQAYDPQRIPKIMTVKNGEDGVVYDELIKDQGYFFSYCEHHMVPFFGEYYFGYIPDKLLMGASKIARTVDYFAGRLQIAERLVNDVVTRIDAEVKPKGQILIMKARHLCKEMRGVRKWDSPFEVIAVRGCFATNERGCKEEFLSRIKP